MAAASGSGTPTAPTVRAIVSATSSGSVDAGQLDEPHGGELGQQVGGGVDGEAGLADAPDAGERDDPVAPRHGDEPLDVEVPPDQRRALGRQVVGVGVDAADRRELLAEVGVDDLPHPLRLGQVAQPVGAEVGELGRAGARADEGGRHVREQDLAAVADGHDAGGAVDGPAPEVVTDPLDLAGVDAHAHGQTRGGHLVLGGDGGLQRTFDRREGGGDAVAHRGEDLTAAAVHRGAQHGEVLLDPVVHLG